MKKLLLLIALAGCTNAPIPPPAAPAPGEAMTERDRSARSACEARGRMTAATPGFGGPGMGSTMGGMLSQQGAGELVTRRCWESYRATGRIPPS